MSCVNRARLTQDSRGDKNVQIDLFQAKPVTGGADESLARLDLELADSKARGSDLLITPEMYLTGYNIGADRVNAAAEPADGPMTRRLADLARKHKMAILAGFPERDGTAIFNAGILLDDTGQSVLSYRKTHLYGGGDRAIFTPGRTLAPVVDFNGWRLGFAICYDIEFPELARRHAQAGAEVILCPTANMLPYQSIPNRIVPSRAEENEIYVAYANYIGQEGDFNYCGLSCVCGPDGEDRARASAGTEEVITASLDRADFNKIRSISTHFVDWRPELYR